MGKKAFVNVYRLREAPRKDTACSNGILPNSVSTPPQANGHSVAHILTLGLDISTITMVIYIIFGLNMQNH